MSELATNLMLSAAVFAGAFVSGLAGFAGSAVAGAILLRIFQPLEAVPLMMDAASACRPPIFGRYATAFSWEAACC
jgi:hypothetical protein